MDEDLDIFIEEGIDLLDEIERNLMSAEKRGEDWMEAIKVAFGAIHTIKGNSLYLNLNLLSHCCQKAESILADENRTLRLPSHNEFDVLLEFVDLIRNYFEGIKEGKDLESLDVNLKSWLK